MEQQRHGGELYGRMCALCHGENGEGYKADLAPALGGSDFQASVADEHLRAAITNGRSGTTMSAWSTQHGGPLSSSDIDALVVFIRSWSDRPRAVLDESKLTGDATRGQSHFEKLCVRCHGSRGMGGPNMGIGNPQLLATASNGFLRYTIGHGRSGTPMQSYAVMLADQGIDDVVAYLRELQAEAATQPPSAAPPPAPIPLGPVPLNPGGPAPTGLLLFPATTPADVIKAQLDRKARLSLLDARTPSDYLVEHIAAAVSVPFYNPEPYFAGLPTDGWIVAYCACPHAESGALAQKLLDHGFKQVAVLDEGFGVWKSKGYPTRAGREP
jgi:cytochrome c oxidase cbb3-type subunit 3/ubiquinol-cytochrome c reductase cytochrome c subunit